MAHDLDTLHRLLQAVPSAAMIANPQGDLPLHTMVKAMASTANEQRKLASLCLLLAAAPAAATVQNAAGRLTIQLLQHGHPTAARNLLEQAASPAAAPAPGS